MAYGGGGFNYDELTGILRSELRRVLEVAIDTGTATSATSTTLLGIGHQPLITPGWFFSLEDKRWSCWVIWRA